MTARRFLRGFFDQGGEEALVRAVRAVEAASSAEVVVTVRRSSGSYRDASLLIGVAGGVATLAFGLFSPWPFSLEWLLVDPVVAGLLVAWGTRYLPALRRWVTLPRERRRRVDVHARAAFVERRVGSTKKHTGVLVYVSLLERAARVVADSGVTERVPSAEWHRSVEDIERAAHRSKATVVAQAIASLGPTLSRYLPRGADDENELPDEVSV